MLAKGTLVRVKDRALKIDYKQAEGTLWIITEERIPQVVEGAGAYRCRSLATGERWTWFTDEFDIEEQDNGEKRED